MRSEQPELATTRAALQSSRGHNGRRARWLRWQLRIGRAGRQPAPSTSGAVAEAKKVRAPLRTRRETTPQRGSDPVAIAPFREQWQKATRQIIGSAISRKPKPVRAPLASTDWRVLINRESSSLAVDCLRRRRRRNYPAATRVVTIGGILLRWCFCACHRSYWDCIPVHNSGLVLRASESFSAISAEMPAEPFSTRDNVTRVT